MASTLHLTLLLIIVFTLTLHQTSAQGPVPPPSVPADLNAVLVNGSQFTYFQRLLNVTQVGNQIANQINTNSEGLTVFAPTDNAFQILKPGTINDLTPQEQVQLVLGHVLPKFYSFDDFQTISNPVRTQGSTSDGQPIVLEIVPIGNRQLNVSTGVVTVQVYNALREAKPLAVYQIDKVLLPKQLFGGAAKAPETSEAPKSSSSEADSPAAEAPNAGNCLRSLGVGVVAGVGLLSVGFLF